jgi:hypothetical protein
MIVKIILDIIFPAPVYFVLSKKNRITRIENRIELIPTRE